VYDKDGSQVFALGDGVGALPSSPIASRAAVDAVVAAAELGQLDNDLNLDEVLSLVDESVGFAVEESAEKGATTLVALSLSQDSEFVFSVGDSEAHEILANGESRLLHDLDHVPAQPNVLLAWIDGHTPFDVHRRFLSRGESYLCLMSDGVPGSLSNQKVADLVRGNSIATAARALVLAARDAGANDDLTAIVIAPIGTGTVEPTNG